MGMQLWVESVARPTLPLDVPLRSSVELFSILTTGLARRYGGALQVTGSEAVGRVHLYNGAVAWAACSDHREHLGHVLQREAGVSPEDLEAAMDECRRTGRKLALVLVREGRVDHHDLRRCLRIHVGNHLRHVLAMEGPWSARFDLEPDHHYDVTLTFGWGEILEAAGSWR